MRVLYHHRTQAEDGQAVHIRALIRAFEEVGHEVHEVGLVRQGAGSRLPETPESGSPGAASNGRARWGWQARTAMRAASGNSDGASH